MSKGHHRQHRADDNQAEIVAALRATGHSVLVLSQVGGGCPDLLVARNGTQVLLEIKQPGEDMTAEQLIFFNEWNGPVRIVHDFGEALDAVNRYISAFAPR